MPQPLPPIPTTRLLNGVEMPVLGLGTWPMNDAEAAIAVRGALAMGYRLIDTAENYHNETGVGKAIRTSGLKREDIFITTKLNRQWHSITGARQACEASLKRLDLDYIDLFLIHWPNPDQDRYVEAFQGLVRLHEAGLVRAIGTSNFKPAHLQRLFDQNLIPHVNQIQLDPYHRRDDLTVIHLAKGIVTESWSPLGRNDGMLKHPVIESISQKHGRTPAQIVLRWHIQSGYVPTPKSSDPKRQADNLNIFNFKLTDEDLSQLNRLGRTDPAMLDADIFGH